MDLPYFRRRGRTPLPELLVLIRFIGVGDLLGFLHETWNLFTRRSDVFSSPDEQALVTVLPDHDLAFTCASSQRVEGSAFEPTAWTERKHSGKFSLSRCRCGMATGNINAVSRNMAIDEVLSTCPCWLTPDYSNRFFEHDLVQPLCSKLELRTAHRKVDLCAPVRLTFLLHHHPDDSLTAKCFSRFKIALAGTSVRHIRH